jgi:hypothetical protein
MREASGPISTISVLLFLCILLSISGCLGFLEGDDQDHIGSRDQPDNLMAFITSEGVVQNNSIIEVHLTLRVLGTEGVDMRNIVLYVSCMPQGGPMVVEDLLLGTIEDNDGPRFLVEEVFGTDDAWNPDGSPSSFVIKERSMIVISVDLIEHLSPLPPGSSIGTVVHETTTGLETTKVWQTPSAYPTIGTVLLED